MKKLLLFVACALSLSACNLTGEKQDAAQQERDSLQRIINEKDMELDDILSTFNEVQEGIRRVNEAEGRVTIAEGNPESASSRDVIRENMEFIQQAMQQNRDMIAQLQEKLKNSSIKASKMQKTIENLQNQIETQAARIQELEASLAEKDALIEAQGDAIAGLSNNVASLTEENRSKAEKVQQQEKELNSAWFVFGTKSELKEQKILSKGDVLKSSDFNKDYFTKIDIRYDKDLKFYSKSAQLLSTHPAGSYQLVKDKQGQYEIHITVFNSGNNGVHTRPGQDVGSDLGTRSFDGNQFCEQIIFFQRKETIKAQFVFPDVLVSIDDHFLSFTQCFGMIKINTVTHSTGIDEDVIRPIRMNYTSYKTDHTSIIHHKGTFFQ